MFHPMFKAFGVSCRQNVTFSFIFFVAFVAPTRSYMFNRSLPRTVACVVFFISNVHVCFKMDDFEMRDECEFTRENCHRRWSTQMGIDVRMGVETG